MFKFEKTLNTVGDGFWSFEARKIKTTELEVAYINSAEDFGELRVYFDTDTWSVAQHGLIYTDSLFIDLLKQALAQEGFDTTGIDYSEQGMQGKDYVSLDVGKEFLDSWFKVVDNVDF